MAGPFGGIMSESPPVAGVPASSGAGLPSQDAFLKFMQQYMQMQEQMKRGAGVASGAIAGVPAGGPVPPYGGGVTPGGPVAQAAQKQASIPTGTPGTPGSAFPARAPQVQQAQQVPYAATGKGAWAANAVYGVSNMLARQRQEDQQKEYTTAENLWTQILNAQANMQKAAEEGKDDPYDKQVIDTILSDKKNVKMIQDALGTLTMDPNQQQQGQQDPAKQAQSAGAKGALQKFGQKLGGLFDPRTQAQRMPSGVPGAAPNTPGGVMWNYPQPTTEQREKAAIEAQIQAEEMKAIMQPGKAKEIAEQRLSGMTAYQQAEVKAKQEQTEMQRTWHQDWVDMNAKYHDEEVERQKKKDELEHKDRQAKIAAAAKANRVDPTALNSLMEKFMSGQMTKADLSKINDKALRNAVIAGMQGHPFANPLTTKQQENLQLSNQTERLIPETLTNLDALLKQYPNLEKAETSTWENAKGVVANRLRLEAYKGGAYVDPMWTKYYELVGSVEARGLAPFMQIARNRNMMDLATVHIPKPTDTPVQLRQKLEWFQKYIVKDTQNEINAVRWGTNIPPYQGGNIGGQDPYWGNPDYVVPTTGGPQ